MNQALIAVIAADIVKQCGGNCSEAIALRSAARFVDPNAPFGYSPWRHGGWYVGCVRYPGGATGCVSRNYPDKKWRIACDTRPFETAPTFRSRDEAARAEQALALSQYILPEMADPFGRIFALAESHIEDAETGVEDGTYVVAENDTAGDREALESARAQLATLRDLATKVFIVIWGGGDEPEAPHVTVHPTLAQAIAQAREHVGELVSDGDAADFVDGAMRELETDGRWSDPTGDTHILIQDHKVSA